jgi:quinol monooxygenase YgiN
MKTRLLVIAALLIITGVSCKQSTSSSQLAKPEVETAVPLVKKMIIARVYIKPEREADFISAAKSIIENSNKEEGCLDYMLYQDPYESTNFIFVESYKDQAAIDFHFGTDYFKEFGTTIGDMTSKPTEIKILDISAEN